EVDTSSLLYFHYHLGSRGLLKTRLLDINPVFAGKQIWKGVEPISVGGLGAFFQRAEIRQGNLSSRNRRPRRIKDAAGNRAVGGLAECQGREEEQKTQRNRYLGAAAEPNVAHRSPQPFASGTGRR